MTHRVPARLALAVVSCTAVTVLAACSTDPALVSDPAPSGGTAAGAGTTTDAAADPAAYPVTVESCGHSSTYDRAPSRVLLGFPRMLETLDALGVGDAAAGYALGSYDALPAGYPADVVEVSPDYAPSRESVLAARPDLFLANDEGQVTSEGAIGYRRLDETGAGSYVMGGYCADAPASRSFDVVYDDLAALGEVFGVPDRATEVADDVRARVAAAAARGAGQDLRVAYVQVYDGKLYAISGYPAAGVVAALGQTNEFADLRQNFAEVNREEALTRTPDVLLVAYTGAANEEPAVAAASELLAATPAVREGRVYGVDETDFQAGGLALVDHLEQVADDLFGRAAG